MEKIIMRVDRMYLFVRILDSFDREWKGQSCLFNHSRLQTIMELHTGERLKRLGSHIADCKLDRTIRLLQHLLGPNLETHGGEEWDIYWVLGELCGGMMLKKLAMAVNEGIITEDMIARDLKPIVC